MRAGYFLPLLLAGCCTVSPASIEQIAVDRQALEQDLRFLSDDALAGRGLGSPGLEVAAAYHEAAFRALDLEPFGGPGFRQPFDLEASRPDPHATLLFETAAGASLMPALADEMVLVAQRSDLPSEVTAEVVYGGYFIQAPEQEWDNLAGADLAGKLVIAEINEPDSRPGGLFDGPDMTWHGRWVRKYELAASAGAAGILLIHNDAGAGYGWTVVRNGWTSEQLYLAGAPTAALSFMGWLSADAGARVVALAGQDRAALRAQAESRDFRPLPLPLHVRVRQQPEFRQVRAENVVGLLRATDPAARDRYVVVSAHYDHMGEAAGGVGDRIYNGAIDNCSASAALLATARVLAPQRDRLQVNVVFLAASAEEEGLLGTEWFVTHLPVPAGSILANVNFEMTSVWNRTRDVYAIASRHSDMEEICADAARNLGLEPIPERDGEKGYFFRSDQFAFVRHGIPGVWLHEGLVAADPAGPDVAALRRDYERNHYHHVTDDFHEDWSLDGTVQMVEWAVAIIDVLSARAGLPGFHPDSPFPRAR